MDLITYVEDLNAMAQEAIAMQDDENSALAKYFTIDEDGQGVTFNVAKVPVVYSKDEQTLCLVRGISRAAIEQSETIKVIGTVKGTAITFDSDESKDMYESVYDTTTKTITDEDGEVHTYTPPYLFGCFF